MAPLPLKRFMEREEFEPHRQDPYRTEAKPHDTPQCPVCRAVSVKGKWLSEREAVSRIGRAALRGKNAVRMKCPACRKLEDRYAMGVIELHGESWKQHSDQVFETIANSEKVARNRNDQERVLWTSNYRGITKVYVTLPELARHIGRVLQRAFKGKTEYHRSRSEPYLRVIWTSEARRASEREPANRVERTRKSRQWRGRGKR